jgi:pimeloyl-ACP methyl ester carboxylesterase
MTTELSRQNATELAAFTDEVIDIAHGLGERVAVAGLSAGGVMASWAAQQRADVNRALLIAPCFSMGVVPVWLAGPLINLCLRLPNFYCWWDPRKKEQLEGPTYAYPRFSTRGMGEVLRLGLAVRRAAAQRAPAAGSIAVVTLGKDLAVSNPATADLVRAWRRNGTVEVETYEFGADLRLPHDLIDPHAVNARIDEVYPVLLELVGQ